MTKEESDDSDPEASINLDGDLNVGCFCMYKSFCDKCFLGLDKFIKTRAETPKTVKEETNII